MPSSAKAVVLLSGGIDSATTVALAQRGGFEVHALSFRYGQRHALEVEAARRVAERLRVREHRIVTIDLRAFGGSALTDDLAVPKDRSPDAMAHDIPVTYVPARNTIFLAYALAWAEVLGASDIFLGVNALGRDLLPDAKVHGEASMGQLTGYLQEQFRAHTPNGWECQTEARLLLPRLSTILGYAPRADVVLMHEGEGRRLWIEFEVSRADPVANHAKFATAHLFQPQAPGDFFVSMISRHVDRGRRNLAGNTIHLMRRVGMLAVQTVLFPALACEGRDESLVTL